jgi:hypothetical protein
MQVNKTAIFGFLLSIPILITCLIIFPGGYGFLAFVSTMFAVYLLFSIVGEFKALIGRLSKRGLNISQTSEGKVLIKGKIEGVSEPQRTWITDEPSTMRKIVFSHYKRRVNTSGKNGKRVETTHLEDLYRTDFSHQAIRINDGTGDCWILLHNSDGLYHSKSLVKKVEDAEEMLKKKPIDGFPMEKLEEVFKKVHITEEWVPVGQSLSVYGNIQKIKVGERPKGFDKGLDMLSRLGMAPVGEMYKGIWEQIDEYTRQKGKSEYRLISAQNFTEGLNKNSRLTVSSRGLGKLNWRSVWRILLMLAITAIFGVILYYLFLEFV